MAIRTQQKHRVGEVIYLVTFFLLCVKYALEASLLISIPDMLDNILSIVILVGFALKFLLQIGYTRHLIPILLVIALVIYSCLRASNFTFLYTFLAAFSLQNISLRKVLSLSCTIKLVTIIFHVLYYVFTYFTNPSVINYVYRGGVQRHYFFLSHANVFTAMLTWALLELLFLHYHKIKWFHLAAAWLISLVFYRFTDSNTGMLILSISLLLIIWDKRSAHSLDIVLTPLAKYGHFAFSLLFPLLIAVYTRLGGAAKQLWDALNRFFSGRLLYGAFAYDVYGFTLFGRAVQFPSKSYWRGLWFDNILFDNYYIGQFLLYGIDLLIIVSLALFLFAGRMKNIEKIMLLIFILYGVMENIVTNVTICFALLLIGKYMYSPSPEAQTHPLEGAATPLWKQNSVS